MRTSWWVPLLVLACQPDKDEPEIPDETTGLELPDCDPGPPDVDWLHRLSNAEYDRTVRDLVDLPSPAGDFPPDLSSAGYDHVSAGQSIAPIHVEAWASAATLLADAVIDRDLWHDTWDLTADASPESLYEVAAIPGGDFVSVEDPGREWVLDVPFPEAGQYTVIIEALWTAGWQNPGDVPTPSKVWARAGDGRGVEADITSRFDSYAPVEITLDVAEGATTLSLEFLVSRAIAVRRVQVLHAREGGVLPCVPGESCPWTIDWLTRAWRRPPTNDDLARMERLMALARSNGDGPEVGLQLVLRASLLSPNFLFLVEDNQQAPAGSVVELSPWERATRMSYALWRTMPDETLFACAAAGGLQRDDDPCGIEAQTDRMLADPRADVLVRDWAEQWLDLRRLRTLTRDAERFPSFTPTLATAMAESTLRTLKSMRADGTDLLELLDRPTAWVDDELAAHYGLDPVADWQQVDLALDRHGLLRQGAVLSLTSTPTRTSPVKRGQWVLTHLLCDPVDEPPLDIGELDENIADPREALEAHLTNPSCSGCHERLDPVGLALEGYDALGQLQDADTTGTLPDGTELAGVDDLVDVLRNDPAVRTCMARQFMTWSLSRRMEDGSCAVDHVTAQAADAGFSIDDLARATLASPHAVQRQVPE